VSITMTVSGADRSLRFDWPAAARAWGAEVAPPAEGMMRAHAPFRTGRMRSGISSRTEEGDGSLMVVLYATAPYTPFVVGGTGPHAITARNARALRWAGRGGIGVSFARSVQHPGTKPDDFPETAMAAITPMVLSRFVAAVKEATLVE
jgi:hypothetical protein